MYVADKYDPAVKTAEERAVANSWCMFANASVRAESLIEPSCLLLTAQHSPHTSSPSALTSCLVLGMLQLGPAIFVEELRQRQMADLFGVLDAQLKKGQPFLLGDKISVADIAVGSYLAYIPRFFPQIKLDAYPKLAAYVASLTQRPAFKNTVGAPPPASD